MKKLLALFVALVLTMGCALAETAQEGWTCPSCGNVNQGNFCSNCGLAKPEENQDGAFLAALAAWAGSLDLSQSDYKATLNAEGETYTATLRENQTLLEAAVDGLGRLQLDGENGSIVLDVNGQKVVIDVAAFVAMFQEMMAQQATQSQAMQEQAMLLQQLLQQAVAQIIMPSVQYASFDGRVTLHVQFDDMTLQSRLYTFMDGVIKDTDTLQKLLDGFGSYLRMMAPDMPATAQEIQQAWAAMGQPDFSRAPTLTFEGDLMVTPSKGQSEISVNGEINYRGERITCSLEYMPDYDGFSVSAKLVDSNPYTGVQSCTLQADLHNSQLTGTLLIAGETNIAYRLNAYTQDEEAHAVLTSRSSGSGDNWDLNLDGSVNSQVGSFTATANLTTYQDSNLSGASRINLATLNGTVWDGGLNATLVSMGTQIDLRVVEGGSFTRASLSVMNQNSNADYVLWIYPQYENGSRLRLEGSQTEYGRITSQWTLDGSAASDRLSLRYDDKLTGGAVAFSAHNTYAGGKTDMGFEYLNTILSAMYYGPSFNAAQIPTSFRVITDGETSDVTFAFFRDTILVQGAVNAVASETGIASIDASIDQTYMGTTIENGSIEAPSVTLHYEPGYAVLSNGEESYTLQKTVDTSKNLEYTITYSGSPDPLVISAALANGALKASMSMQGKELYGLEIAPTAKTVIEPIDTTGAVVINPDTLEEIITQAMMENMYGTGMDYTEDYSEDASPAD